ncbi:aminotransferase class V-fold PLP-dependent enzyme [Heliorestis acidaminivorans]|uniref:cysteine desulfurase n=1 Tax=Heliorestis acidaminivorans TaxID=553427 RepID=A0A6I0F5G6_9FIRM|nr:aminotransferase class V-fold PLP-dependent enzyme [Heliorestis acidaminivorans]KAB2953917.1 aminotransferase class V-fold PLP-dependent enzyme [Heliorestis acidaminivorans]
MIYLDNAATTWPKPESVWQEVLRAGQEYGANPGRASHQMAIDASRAIYKARVALAQLFNAPDPLRIVFTLNTTEALNMAIFGTIKANDHVITSSLEHNSVARPLKILQDRGVEVTYLQGDEYGYIKPEELKKALRKNSKAFIFSQGSNVTGTLQNAEILTKKAKEYGLKVIIDGAQTAGVHDINIKDWGIDLLAFPGHKGLLGPQGTGGLWIGEDCQIDPLYYGGTGSQSESEYQPTMLPDRFESGTQNGPGIAGLAAGIAFIQQEGREKIENHEKNLTTKLLDGLSKIKKVTLYGPPAQLPRAAVISFNVEGIEASEFGFLLDKAYQIAVRTGLHCAPLAHRRIGTLESGTVRISPGYFTTEKEIDQVLAVMEELIAEV